VLIGEHATAFVSEVSTNSVVFEPTLSLVTGSLEGLIPLTPDNEAVSSLTLDLSNFNSFDKICCNIITSFPIWPA